MSIQPSLRACLLLLFGASLVCRAATAAAPSGAGGQGGAVEAGASRRDARGVEQVWVPAGSFLMGEARPGDLRGPAWAKRELASEQPAHRVTISRGFWIDKYEVGNAAYQAFVADGGYRRPRLWSEEGRKWLAAQDPLSPPGSGPKPCPVADGADYPRACITWFEADAYARWRGGRLPSEAEWEYAARGPDSRRYPWGENFDTGRANVVGRSGTTPAGQFPDGASWVGAQDMAGNLMEWVADWLDADYYSRSPERDPPGPSAGRVKVEKGGWWGSHAYVARGAYRHFEDPPDYQDHHIGVRVLTPGTPEID